MGVFATKGKEAWSVLGLLQIKKRK